MRNKTRARASGVCRPRHPRAVPRPPRDAHAGGYYHVHTRGNNKLPVYVDLIDRYTFLEILGRIQQKYEWIIYAWTLMTNHYHFVMQIQVGLSAGMCELNGGYARWFNTRHGRCNHVFGQRFTSTEIHTEAHLLEACRYVVLHPVRAGLCREPQDWRWSSFRASAGDAAPQRFLARDALLDLVANAFGGREDAVFEVYREFVLAP